MGITSDGFALLIPLSSFSSMDLDFSSPSILMANSAFSESAQLTLAENLTQYLKELGLGPPVQQQHFHRPYAIHCTAQPSYSGSLWRRANASHW